MIEGGPKPERPARANRRLAALWTLSLQPGVDLGEFGNAVVTEACDLLGFHRGSLVEVDTEGAVIATHPADVALPARIPALIVRTVTVNHPLVAPQEDGDLALCAPGKLGERGYVLALWGAIGKSQWLDESALDEASFLATIFAEFAERRRDVGDFANLAFHDALTGLPNRLALLNRIEQTIASAKRNGHNAAVLFVDIDGFKHVNDTLGHSAGDRVLAELGSRFRKALRREEFIGRLGGDEFTAIIPETKSFEETYEVGQRLRELARKPFDVDGHIFGLSASIGVAHFPADGSTAEELLGNGDIAMYRAKEAGGDAVFLFDSGVRQRIETRRRLTQDLQGAMMNREFLVCYQPVIDATTDEIVGAEALARWLHPTDGLLSAESFLGSLGTSNLISLVDAWVLGETAQQNVRWMAEGNAVEIFVNIAVPDEVALGDLDRLMADPRYTSTHLNVEVGETAVMKDVEAAIGFFAAARERGISTGLDRFGGGVSSLKMLDRLPIDFVKLDHSLIVGVERRVSSSGAALAAIAMARAFDWRIIAQGVANAFQKRWLLDNGVRWMQGYGVGQPMTAADFGHWRKITAEHLAAQVADRL